MQATTSATHRITPDDPQLARLIGAERVRMLFAPSAQVLASSVFFSLALGLVVGQQVGWQKTIAWIMLGLIVCGMRFAHWWSYSRSVDRAHPRWLHSLIGLCLLHGAIWGMAGWWLMPVEDLVTSAIIAATLIGASAVSTFTLQAHIAPNLAMNLPMLMPAAFLLLTRMDKYGVFGAVGLSLLCCIMLIESRRAERRITELLWLRFTTDRISQERADALKLAQRHSIVKDQFMATMTHEIRTPLHGILGLAQLIHQRLPARPGVLNDARQHAELIQRSGEHLMSLINDVLDFSRIEAGRLHIEPAAFNLHDVLDDVLALLRVTAASKQLVLRSVIDLPRPCMVTGDGARVRQVLYNLLGNAIKFTEMGEVILRVQRCGCPDAESQNDDDTPCRRRITFAVQDTGSGIPADQIERMFEAFSQMDASMGRRHQGTGLGLTISREIARAMGGDIVCQSTVGQGSTFTFTAQLAAAVVDDTAMAAPNDLRARQAVKAADGKHAHDSSTDQQQPNRRAHGIPPLDGHVLLVEDNPVNAMVAQATLEQLGLRATVVADGMEALALLTQARHGFDAVLMDCQLPVLDGVETTRRLRAHENDLGCPNVPVIALTANALPEDRRKCIAAGMDDHLGKPFKTQELRAVLQHHLQHRAANAVTA